MKYNKRTKEYDKSYQCIVCRRIKYATGTKTDHDVWESGVFVCSFRCQKLLEDTNDATV